MIAEKASAVALIGLLIAATTLPGCAQTNPATGGESSADITYIQPEAEPFMSMATVAPEGAPLAHTDQLMALDPNGDLVGAGDVAAQTEQVLANIERALGAVDAGMADVLKLNAYVATSDAVQQVRDYLSARFTGEAKPALSFAVTSLPHADALVAMDAVAVAPAEAPYMEQGVYRAEALAGASDRGHVAVMPPGGKVYVSGQSVKGEPVPATRESLEAMHDRLAYLGLSANDVVQVKVFMNDIADAEELEARIAEYYREKPSPPVVTVEWTHEGRDIEVELIAARGEVDAFAADDAVSYITPPGLRAPPTYSRVSEINQGDVMYLSGLYGDPSKDMEGQIRDIFQQMGGIIDEAGSDFDHLAKATYYVAKWELGPLGDVREEYYDPKRPPTSSLIPVRGVGEEGALITIDMIGAVPPE